MAETTWDGCVEAGLPSFGVMRMPKDAENAEQIQTLRNEAKQMLKIVQSYFTHRRSRSWRIYAKPSRRCGGF